MRVSIAILLLALIVPPAAANQSRSTASSAAVPNNRHGGSRTGRAQVLLLETTTTALPEAFQAHGLSFDEFYGPPWPDLGCYSDVFVGMDGGLIEPSDLLPLANYASGGGHLHFYGGSCWQDYVDGMNQYLVQNNTGDYCWTMALDLVVVDPNNGLSSGLPATYDWADPAAGLYQLRVQDPSLWVAADNGDGYHMLFLKNIGSGWFDCCIDSPYVDYYAGQDLKILEQIVWNMTSDVLDKEGACCLGDGTCVVTYAERCGDYLIGIFLGCSCDPNPCVPAVPVAPVTWGRVKARYH